MPLQGEEAAGATCETAFPDAEAAAMLGFYRRRKKPWAAELATVAPELEDLVKIATYAHRHRWRLHLAVLVWRRWWQNTQERAVPRQHACRGDVVVCAAAPAAF